MAERIRRTCRNGEPEPLSESEVEAIASTFRFYDKDDLIPRLVATIDQLRSNEKDDREAEANR